mmetsp:Transcript_30402/g.71639  ORF Transcript_30402/g.71639 Transcript_30402/m.71639 type:complete len:194 (-) Transcript_30402:102-683(-)
MRLGPATPVIWPLLCVQSSLRCSEQPSTSIGEVVKGLHGGKYQFDAGGGDRAAGMAFAEALASTRDSAPDVQASVEVPRWAQRLVPERDKLAGALAIAPGSQGSVVVQNRYKTWEPFFVTLHPPEAPWEVGPSQGTLAPRGGANNVCDPSKPYADTQALVVRCHGGEVGDEALLVVGTEEEQWTYSLRVDRPP